MHYDQRVKFNEDKKYNYKKIFNLLFCLLGAPLLLLSSIYCYLHQQNIFDSGYFVTGFFFCFPSILIYWKETSDNNFNKAYVKCYELYSRMDKIELEKIEKKVMNMPNKYFAAEKEAFIKAYHEKK